jgi:hypothetical protein
MISCPADSTVNVTERLAEVALIASFTREFYSPGETADIGDTVLFLEAKV